MKNRDWGVWMLKQQSMAAQRKFAEENKRGMNYDEVDDYWLNILDSTLEAYREEVEGIMKSEFEKRRNELDKVSYQDKSRAFVVAGIDLVYNYYKDVLSLLTDKE